MYVYVCKCVYLVCMCVCVLCFVACSCVMVNESWEAQRQENLGGVAILTCKSCDKSWRKVTDKSNHLSAGSLRSVPQESWSLTASSGKANEQRNPEHVVLDLFSNFTKWVGSKGFFWWTSGVSETLCGQILVSRSDDARPASRVSIPNVSVCTGTTRTCVSSCAWCWHTRRRFEWTHGGFQRDTPQHHTQHHTETEIEIDRERRQSKREKKDERQKTRQEKTRRKRREDR